MTTRLSIRTSRLLVVALFVIPILMIAGLMISLDHWIRSGSPMADAQPVGAGAGYTGGANALGELFAGHKANTNAMPDEHRASPRDESQPDQLQPDQPGARLVAPESLAQGFVLVVEDKSGQADADHPIYLASNLTGWNPGNPAMVLSLRSDSRWQIALDQPTSGEPMQFKFTLGDWGLVEQDADNNDIPNRTLAKVDTSKLDPGEQPVIELVVASFKQGEPQQDAQLGVDPYHTLAVTGTVRRVQVAGGAGRAIGTTRDLLVWLPPGYDDAANADRRYPVLYLMDGQNLFEKLPGVFGEWHADETAQRLVELGLIEPTVIVGVPHAGVGRMEEYVPLRAMDNFDPAGKAFVAWLFDEVMPRVESTIRVSTDPADTGIGGASLGAVIAAYAAGEHPGRFGSLLLESMPTLPGAAGGWQAYLEGIESWPGRVFVGMGGREASNDPGDDQLNERYVNWAHTLDDLLASRSLGPDRRLVVITPDANHNEDAWAARLPDALQFLFPPRSE